MNVATTLKRLAREGHAPKYFYPSLVGNQQAKDGFSRVHTVVVDCSSSIAECVVWPSVALVVATIYARHLT